MSVGEDEAEQFSLRWNNFHNNLTHGFHELLEEEDLVDVTLACDGKYVQAHKIVLSVCSPYFKSLFRDNPCRHPIVILKDVGHKELQAILQFMYRGEVNVRQDDLTGFLKTAEMLKIKGLTGENNDKDSQKRSFSEEKRRPRGAPTHCDDEASPVPYKRVKQEQRRSRVVTHPSSRAHSPVECIPPSSVSREELMQPEFDVTKPKEEPVDYSQAEDEYSSELGPSIPHEIDEGMEEVEEDVTGEEVSEGRPRGSGRNHLPSEGQGGGGDQPSSALAAMAHLVHAGGPSGSDGQRQDTRGIEPKHMPPLALPSMSGAVMEPNVTLQMESKERLQGKMSAKRKSYSVEYKRGIVKDSWGESLTAFCKEKKLDLRMVRRWRAEYDSLSQQVGKGNAKKHKCGSGPNTRSLEYSEAFVKFPVRDEVRGWDAVGTSENKIHHMRKMEGNLRRNRKRCRLCYKFLSERCGKKVADLKAKKVITYCEDCSGQPPMCLDCFNAFHSN